MTRQIQQLAIMVAVAFAAACARNPSPEPAPNIALSPSPVNDVRIAPADEPLASGDCVEATRRALEQPDLVVDRIPAPVVAKPPALQRPPRTALRRDGSGDVKVDVLIDTLGRADMRTFKVVSASSDWLAKNVRSVIGKWKFSPAELAGCKVPRTYHFMATAPARGRSAD
jgi:outer membrane biosynthesis protein TonB